MLHNGRGGLVQVGVSYRPATTTYHGIRHCKRCGIDCYGRYCGDCKTNGPAPLGMCGKGLHEMVGDNVLEYAQPSGGIKRECRACRRKRDNSKGRRKRVPCSICINSTQVKVTFTGTPVCLKCRKAEPVAA